MKIISRFSDLALLIIFILSFTACNENGDTNPQLNGVIIANAGNFGAANGSISLYDEMIGTISNAVVKTANNNSAIGATIESVFVNNNTGYILCNNPDKIEIIDVSNYKYLDNPITDLDNPRTMVVIGEKGFVSCWGPYESDYSLKNSYVAIIDLNSNQIIKKVPSNPGPQGMLINDDKIYIANSYTSEVSVLNTVDESMHDIEVGAAPQRFITDKQGRIWVSLGSYYGAYGADKTGLAVIDPTTDQVVKFVNLAGISDDGLIAVNGSGEIIYFVKTAAYPDTNTSVYQINTETYEISDNAIVTGNNFSALGCNPTSNKIYIADSNGYQGNGRLMIYDAQGTELDKKTTGIGPYYFVF